MFRKEPKQEGPTLNPFTFIDETLGEVFGTFPLFTDGPSIKVDVKETNDSYIVEAELPGVEKEDIKVELKKGKLTISVANKEDKEEVEEKYIIKERKSTNLTRTFYVERVKEDSIKAKYINGILTLELPKIEEDLRHINVDIE